MEHKRTKREENERRDTILVIVLIFLCILLFGIGNIFSGQVQAIIALGTGGESASSAGSAPATATTAPTATPVPTPSDTPKPDDRQKQAGVQGAAGLGVDYTAIKAAYAAENFTFEERTASSGAVNHQGRSADGLAAVQITGDPQNLSHVSIVVYIVRDQAQVLQRNLAYAAKMIETVLPDWKDGKAWMFSNISRMATMSVDPREAGLTLGNVRVTLRLSAVPEILYLSFDAIQP